MRHASVLAAILCVLLAGCGGSTEGTSASPGTAAFKAGYQKLRGPLNATGEAVAQELQQSAHQTDVELATAFGGLATTFHGQLVELEALKPPANLASAFSAATYAANRVDTDLRSISRAAMRRDATAAGKATTALGRDVAAMHLAASLIKHGLGLG
jgi:hypothetical protein